MHIDASPQVHANQADDVFLRVGDKSKLQTFEERLQLNYDKGERYFEDKAVPDATIDDIDMDFVKEYTDKIDYGKSPLEYLKENRGFIKEKDGEIQISTAAILLFGKNLQNFFSRARIRFIRYEGTEEKFGTEMNVIKDVIFEGTLLNMINEAIAYLDTQVKEKTYLGPDGTFVTDEENAFMLQAVIYNSKVGKTIVEKTADSFKKLAVAINKSLIDYQKPAIGVEKSAIDDKKSAVDRIKSAIEKKKYNEPSKANILKVYDEIEKNQIFGTKEIKEILDCSPSTARAVMTKLRDMKVVKAVNGKGKGKYVFIE